LLYFESHKTEEVKIQFLTFVEFQIMDKKKSFEINHKKRNYPGEFWVAHRLNLSIGMLWIINQHPQLFGTDKDILYKHRRMNLSAFMYIREENKIFCNDTLIDTFLELMKDSRTRFVIAHLIIIYDKIQTHSNMIIVDKKNKRIERFEPELDYDNKTDRAIKKYFISKGIIDTYVSSRDYFPVGPQQYQHCMIFERPYRKKFKVDGFCGAWSLWYTNLRLKYPDLPLEELRDNIQAKLSEYKLKGITLTEIINSFSIFIIRQRLKYERIFERDGITDFIDQMMYVVDRPGIIKE